MSSTEAPADFTPVLPHVQVSGRRIVLLAALSLAAGLGVARWLETRGTISFSGTLQAHKTNIIANSAGRIEELKLSLGQAIIPGDTLVKLSGDGLSAQIEDKQRSLVELEAEFRRVTATAEVELEWRNRELNSEIFQTQLKQSNLSQEKIVKQVEELAWREFLKGMTTPADGIQFAEGVVPARNEVFRAPFTEERRMQAILQEDAAAAAAESLARQLELCDDQLKRLWKLQKELPEKVQLAMGVDLAKARIARTKEEIAGLQKQQDGLAINSPAHGVVSALNHRSGDLVHAGETILQLHDDERRYLIAEIPSSAMNSVRVGTRLNLVFPGKEQRVGLVTSIPPRATQFARVDDSHVEVTIEPAGKLWPRLPIGSRVQVKVPD